MNFSGLFPVHIGSDLSPEAPKWAPYAFSGQETETEFILVLLANIIE